MIVDVRLEDRLGLTVVKRLVGGSQVLVVTGHFLDDEIRTEAWRLGAAVAYKPFLLGDSSTTRFDVRVVAATNRTGR